MKYSLNPLVMSFIELALFAAIMMAAFLAADKKKAEVTLPSTQLATQPAIAQTMPSFNRQLLKRISDLAKDLKTATTQRQADETDLNNLRALLAAEPTVRANLLGLTSNAENGLGNVVFIFDHTSDMFTTGAWAQARAIFNKWIENLSVDRCAVIFFGTSVDAYANGEFVDMKTDSPERENLVRFFDEYNKAPPRGYTNTRAALERAFECKGADAIIIFTHGAPRIAGTDPQKDFDDAEERKIYALCAQRKVPINVVAVGNYFDEASSSFLTGLAQKAVGIQKDSHGAFLGQ